MVTMTDTNDLIAFLRARLVGDQQEAVGAGGNRTDPLSLGQAHHIARHDPARVLAEVEAKRRLVELHQPANPDDEPEDGTPGWPDHAWYYCATCGSGEPYTHPTEWPCPTLRLIALPHSDHPDYREGWRP